MSRGHVFIAHGDLLKLDCDARAVSSGGRQDSVSAIWRGQGISGVLDPSRSRAVDARRVVRRVADAGAPWTYVVPIAGSESRDVPWYTSAIRTFLELAFEDVMADAGRRRPPRIALPFLGSGDGGYKRRKGDLLAGILETLQAFVADHDADVVFVARDADSYDAAQAVRRRLPGAWDRLAPDLRDRADELARQAQRGELALFLGAGLSMNAGLPSWKALLATLATRAGLGGQLAALEKLSPLEAAQRIELACAGPGALAQYVVDEVQKHERHALAHALLAKLPVHEVVTTNYDRLFEDAVHAIDGARATALRVIPYDGPPEHGRRWLMKLHGCVTHPEDIVLSRKTFLRYETQRAALAGVLAGLFVTRHVLFVGSSFSDDNVIRILDEVLRLWERGAGDRPPPLLGSNLAVGGAPLRDDLWRPHFHWIPLGDSPAGGRVLDVFLDRMAATACTGAAYFFADTFLSLCTDEDREARELLELLVASMDQADNPALAAAADELRRRFGAPRITSPDD